MSRKIFSYSISQDGNINKQIFNSIGETARVLNCYPVVIRNHIDKWKIGGINQYYLFSKELNDIEINKLIELINTKIFKIWVYNADTLELIDGSPFNSLLSTAKCIGIDFKTIKRHLDTKVATKQNGSYYLFLTDALSEEDKTNLSFKRVEFQRTHIWVYKKSSESNKLMSINNNEPTFISIYQASKELNISRPTISKYLDTNKDYNDLLFFSEKLNDNNLS